MCFTSFLEPVSLSAPHFCNILNCNSDSTVTQSWCEHTCSLPGRLDLSGWIRGLELVSWPLVPGCDDECRQGPGSFVFVRFSRPENCRKVVVSSVAYDNRRKDIGTVSWNGWSLWEHRCGCCSCGMRPLTLRAQRGTVAWMFWGISLKDQERPRASIPMIGK